uniref:Uncharacterized protein n=1 Tax=Magallana gigas TaxID=29159 RepID=A0A8W8NP91_MAGGI
MGVRFSERDCEGLLDARRHCGWYRIPETVGKIESNIPPLPDNVQTRFYGFNIVGDFGDGYIDHLPSSIQKDKLCPLTTGFSPSESLFASISILIWGDVKKVQFLRLAVVCHEITVNVEKT